VKAWPLLEWGTLGLSLGVALSTLMGAANRPVPFLALPGVVAREHAQHHEPIGHCQQQKHQHHRVVVALP
uniref:hypothetical protein n=1 Tax=Metapseudomonas otitidis TaxID=319939 RepID=UPI00374DF8DC